MRPDINVPLPLSDLKIEINSLQPKADLARKLGFASDYRMGVGTDVVEKVIKLCREIKSEFNYSTVFTGKLVFRHEQLFHKLLHNEMAFAIQRKLHWE